MDIMVLSLKSQKNKSGPVSGPADRTEAPDQGPRRYRARINREPVLDRMRVQELAGGVHSQSRLLEFLDLFLVLLPSRVKNVVSALDSGDVEAASAAAQSLASSAAMAGASRLELVAWLVDNDLRMDRMDRARETARRLGPDADELASALSRLLTGC
jgi:HPt (histidine-containing phosphotransfer) domain-containing protein